MPATPPDARSFHIELPPGWLVLRTGSSSWHQDVEQVLDTQALRHWSKDLRSAAAQAMEELVVTSRQAGVQLVAVTVASDRRTGLQLGAITASLGDTGVGFSSLEMCRRSLEGRPDVQEVQTSAGPAVMSLGVDRGSGPLADLTGDGYISRCTTYLPVVGTPLVLVTSVQLSGRRRLALARMAGVRLAESFRLVDGEAGPRWA